MSTILIVTANPLLDCLHDGEIIPGQVTRSAGMHVIAGGKGINVGRVLTAHDHHVIATGFAGGWSGRAFRDLVQAEDQKDAFVDCDARLRIGFLAQNCVQAGSTAVLENGFHVSASEQENLLNTVHSHAQYADLVIISGSTPDPSCEQLFVHILDICAQAKVDCWIDSYGPAMRAALNHQHPPLLIKPNRQEYGNNYQWSAASECHISNGEKSVSILTENHHYTVEVPNIQCINAIGSGDSYLGALAHARLAEHSFEQQARYAVAAGSINASQMAVATMNPQDIKALSANIHIDRETR